MKKIFPMILIVSIILSLGGCNCDTQNQNSEKTPVIINVPSDTETIENDTDNKAETPSITTGQSVTVDNQSISYCGNKNSKKFHKSTCGALKTTKDENKVCFKNRSDYINQGFVPCKRCNP